MADRGGVDSTDLVIIEAYRIGIPVTQANIAAAAAEVRAAVEHTFRQGDGAVQPVATRLTVDGMPAVGLKATMRLESIPAQSTLIFAFHATTEYFFNCEYTKAHEQEMKQGCMQIVDTFSR